MTPSPAPSTSLSSPILRLRGMGRKMGLASIILVGRRVGLDVMLTDRGKGGYAVVIVGEDAAELAADVGMLMGMEIGSLDALLFIGEFMDGCESLRYDNEGETARRFELLG